MRIFLSHYTGGGGSTELADSRKTAKKLAVRRNMAKIWTISRKSHHPIATFVRFNILFLQLLKRFSTHTWRTGVDNKDKQRPAITKSLIQSQFSGLHISPPS